MKLFIIILLIAGMIFSMGCLSEPNYSQSHELAKPHFSGCDYYYEDITVIAKNQEIVKSGFGSRTSYVIVTNDNIDREAASFRVYNELDLNKTFKVISSDRMGCGYADHHVWITEVVS